MHILRTAERMLRAPFEVPPARERQHVLLASYPKSGSTWLRFILANLSREIGGHALEVDFATVARYAPEIRRNRHLRGTIETPGFPLFLKTHFPWIRGFAPYRSVVIVRHPADVLVSHYRHLGTGAGKRLPSLDRFVRHWRHGAAAWRDWHLSWYGRADHVIRYEDLLAEPRTTVGRLCREFGDEPPEAALDTALARSTRDRMRRLQAERGNPNLRNQGFQFVGTGSNTDAPVRLEDEDRRYIERVAGPALERYGYGAGGP